MACYSLLQIRTIVSPIFTSGKLRKMVHHVDKCSRNLEEFFSNAARMGETLEAKDIYGKLALDAIATSGFGIESNSMKVCICVSIDLSMES